VSLHPISDKAEVSVDFPDKAYIGSFGRHSQFDAYADDDGVAVRLVRRLQKRAKRGRRHSGCIGNGLEIRPDCDSSL